MNIVNAFKIIKKVARNMYRNSHDDNKTSWNEGCMVAIYTTAIYSAILVLWNRVDDGQSKKGRKLSHVSYITMWSQSASTATALSEFYHFAGHLILRFNF